MEKIFIVEDEKKLADVLDKYITENGFETQVFDQGLEVVEAVREHQPALVVLDIMLPGKSGIDICKEIRRFSVVPIIMVTAKVEEVDRLLGLELGADDYICKPFSPREVVARIKAILKRVSYSADKGLNQELGIYIDAQNFRALFNGKSLDLTPVEFKILSALYGPPSRVLTRDALMNKMYDDHRAVNDRTVDSHIANLRKKLKVLHPGHEYIQPVYGVGYRYADPLE
ncbi:MAG: response regulator [Acidiferrobacterales bacterium]|nr:response regulator [Acidiferrobacterales bacterium]